MNLIRDVWDEILICFPVLQEVNLSVDWMRLVDISKDKNLKLITFGSKMFFGRP